MPSTYIAVKTTHIDRAVCEDTKATHVGLESIHCKRRGGKTTHTIGGKSTHIGVVDSN